MQDRVAQELLSRGGAARDSPQATSTPSNSQVPRGPSWAGTKEGAQFFEEHFPSLPSPSQPGFADSFVGEIHATYNLLGLLTRLLFFQEPTT